MLFARFEKFKTGEMHERPLLKLPWRDGTNEKDALRTLRFERALLGSNELPESKLLVYTCASGRPCLLDRYAYGGGRRDTPKCGEDS